MRLGRAVVAAAFVACSPAAAPQAASAPAIPPALPSLASSASGSPTPAPTPSALPTPAADSALPAVRLERSFGGLAFAQMTGAYQASDGRWYVLEQAGRIMTFKEGDARPSVYLDIHDRVESGGEKGLLGFAFAFDFDRSGVFFVDYTQGGPLRTHISSFTSSGGVADKTSEAILLEIAQPFDNHNGGQLAFGPDGLLYVAMGDGGSGGDPMRNGQNTSALLGKILRIDVADRTAYRIPPDNPFAAGGGRGEVFAYGMRNPWRFSFDRQTDALWVADVGQNLWEEIDVVTKGGNYGWNVMEGAHCYSARRCDATGLVPPIFEYGHDLGCSITGGFVYRGAAVPEMRGAYVYGDFCSGRIWGLRYADGRVTAHAQMAMSGFQISSFAQDQKGELYALQYASAGSIYRLTR